MITRTKGCPVEKVHEETVYGWFLSVSQSPLLAAVEIVSWDDRGAALRVFVSRTVIRVVAALDASARTAGFDELDVVVIAQANATLGVSQPTGAPTGVVLTPCVVRVQSVECLRTDTSGYCISE